MTPSSVTSPKDGPGSIHSELPTDLTPQATGWGHEVTLDERTKASRGQAPDTEAQDGEGQMGCPIPADLVLGLPTTWQGEGGPLRGRWHLSPLLSLLFNSLLPGLVMVMGACRCSLVPQPSPPQAGNGPRRLRRGLASLPSPPRAAMVPEAVGLEPIPRPLGTTSHAN